MHPIDKTINILKNFVFMTPRKGTQKDVTSPPQWDGFLYVLSTSDLTSLSLDGVENPEKNGTQGEFTSKKQKNMTMMEDQSQTKSIDQEVISRQQKVVTNGKAFYL